MKTLKEAFDEVANDKVHKEVFDNLADDDPSTKEKKPLCILEDSK